jgi:hypothetical protein
MRGAVLSLAMKLKRLLPWIAVIVAFAFLLLAGALVLERLVSLPAHVVNSAANQVATEVAKVREAFIDLFHLQPNINVSENVLLEQTATAPELVIASRDAEVTRDAVQTWWGSTKTIRLRSVYRVKAGFDLAQKFDVQVRESEITIKVAPAKILNVEPLSMTIEELRDGLWNKIQAQDIENEVNKMPELARAKSSSLPEEAQKIFEHLLATKLGDQHLHVEFVSEALPSK